ncbi:MAG: hypothetical protein A2V77_05475 [Anaeromyxobacter sp. RBG_16_69_14]|nr:MAG: hypothetical protein A2V77_05475 [Anaeromyxobacter sp. RBG_16_69_14]
MAEERTSFSLSLTDLLFEEPGVGRCLVAPDGSILRANAEWLHSTGLSLDDVLGADIIDLFPETRDTALAMHTRARAGHRVEVPRHAQVLNGRETWWEGSIAPVPMESGTGLLITARELSVGGVPLEPAGLSPVATLRPEGIITSIARIFEKALTVESEEARHASQATLEAALTSMTDAVFISDAQGRFVHANEAFATYHRFPSKAECSKALSDCAATLEVWAPDGSPVPVEQWAVSRALRGETATGDVEFTLRRRDTGETWVGSYSFAPILKDGEIVGSVVVARDVTERKRAEQALRASEDRFRHLVEQVGDGIFVASTRGRYTDVNPAGCEMLGMTREEVLASTFVDVLAPEEIHRLEEQIDVLSDDRVHRSEWRFRRKDGSVFVGELDGRRLSDGTFQGVLRDITERKRAEERVFADLAALTRMHALSGRVVEGSSIEPLLQETMDAAVAIMAASKGTLQLLEGDTLKIVAHCGHDMPFLDFFDEAEAVASVCGEATRRGERVLVPDVETSPIFAGTASLPVLRAAGVRAVQSTPLRTRAGRPLGILTTHWSEPHTPDESGLWRLDLLARQAADLIEQKQTYESLRASEERFRTLAENNPHIIARYDRQHRILYINQAAQGVTKQPPGSFVGKSARELGMPPEVCDRWEENQDRAFAGERVTLQTELADPDGRQRSILDLFVPEYAADGSVQTVLSISEDITELVEAQKALRESERQQRQQREFLECVITSAGACIAVVQGHELRYTLANPAFHAFAGAPMVGRTYREVFPEAAQAGAEALLQRVLETGEPWKIENYDAPVPGVADAIWEGQVVRLPATEGEEPSALAVVWDVTARRRAELALEDANAGLREADRRKTEFLAVLSHELRNPLAPIRNSIHLLEHAAPGSAQATRAREVVRRQTEHLTRLVDDLLDVTRISRGKIQLQRKRVDARQIVRQTCDDHRAMFHERRLALHVDTSDPVWIDADETRLVQAVGNLLQNAAKFGHEGGVVTVNVGGADGWAEICVRDEGVGISPDLLPRLFEPFVQADGGLARTKGGLGLGLALVKALVGLHGGSVRVCSEGLDRGAEVIVRLPLSPVPEQPASDLARSTKTKPIEILVIEDNLDAAQSLADVLELEGHRVHVATDGRSGIARTRELKPEVVLCDIGLPDVSGYEVARILRADDGLRSTRLIALSGYAQAEDRLRASEAGFDDHIPKPPSLPALLAAVASEQHTARFSAASRATGETCPGD